MARKKATINENDEVELEKDDGAPESTVSAASLRQLIFLGSIEKVVSIGSFKFKMRTLSGRQQKAALALTMKHDEEERLSILRTAILSSAIVEVNGVPMSEVCAELDDSEVSGDLEKKMFVIESLQTSVVDKLYLEYDALTKESNASVGEQNLKN